jgi:hypothetical protein
MTNKQFKNICEKVGIQSNKSSPSLEPELKIKGIQFYCIQEDSSGEVYSDAEGKHIFRAWRNLLGFDPFDGVETMYIEKYDEECEDFINRDTEFIAFNGFPLCDQEEEEIKEYENRWTAEDKEYFSKNPNEEYNWDDYNEKLKQYIEKSI